MYGMIRWYVTGGEEKGRLIVVLNLASGYPCSCPPADVVVDRKEGKGGGGR